MGTHNGRGWVPAAGSSIKGLKLKALLHIASSNDVMAFQETHGTIAQLVDATKPIRSKFFVFWSSIEYDEVVNLSIDSIIVPPARIVSDSSTCFGKPSVQNFDRESSSTKSCSSYSYCSDDCSQNSSYYSDTDSLETESDQNINIDSSPSLAGGVLTTIRRSIFSSNVLVVAKVWVPGRILEISITDGNKTFTIFNIHTFSALILSRSLLSRPI